MRCIVTGGAGFIGSHLSDLLINEGHEVIIIDNLKCGHLKNLKEIENHPNLTFIEADIRDKEAIASFFKDIDVVYHLAALADIVPSIENPREYFETNVDGTFNVLEAGIENKIKKFVYSASSSCYGIATEYPTTETAKINPQYPYALTKYLGEETVMHFEKVYKLPAISLRFFNVYGPRARTTGAYGAVFGVFLAQKLNNKPLTVVGDGSQTRDFTYVTDVANAIYTASLSDISGEIFNVGSSGHYSVNQLVALLDSKTIQIPKRPGEPDCTFADVSKIKKMLNWEAKVSFEEGVKKLLSKIDDFKDAPVWDKKTIEKATEKWFKYLSPKEGMFQ
jgi:UDP-glucose 4-epimerase